MINAPTSVLLHAEIIHNLNKNFSFALGSNNIADDNGPIDPSHSSGHKYSSTSQLGANGCLTYAKITYAYYLKLATIETKNNQPLELIDDKPRFFNRGFIC